MHAKALLVIMGTAVVAAVAAVTIAKLLGVQNPGAIGSGAAGAVSGALTAAYVLRTKRSS